jgi:hypothetical protein
MRCPISALIILLLGAHGAAQDATVVGLSRFAGKDLRTLDKSESATIDAIVTDLTGDVPGEGWHLMRPWRVEPFPVGEAAWILLEGYPGVEVPGFSAMRVQVFDGKWKRLIRQQFPTGYRWHLTRITVVNKNPLDRPLVAAKVISTRAFHIDDTPDVRLEDGDFLQQVYALSGERFVLVRVEDRKGGIVPNQYCFKIPTAGPGAPDRTREEWIRTMTSGDAVEQLATLVWLTGNHLSSKAPRHENESQESIGHSEVFEAVLEAEATRNALLQLTDSRNAWVREYANKALTSLRVR